MRKNKTPLRHDAQICNTGIWKTGACFATFSSKKSAKQEYGLLRYRSITTYPSKGCQPEKGKRQGMRTDSVRNTTSGI